MHSSGHDGVALQIHARAHRRRRHCVAGSRSHRCAWREFCNRAGCDCHQLSWRRSGINLPSTPAARSDYSLRSSFVRRTSPTTSLSIAASRSISGRAPRRPASCPPMRAAKLWKMARTIPSCSRSSSNTAAISPSPARAPTRSCRSRCRASGTTAWPAAWAGPMTSTSTSTRSKTTGRPRSATYPSARRRSSLSSTGCAQPAAPPHARCTAHRDGSCTRSPIRGATPRPAGIGWGIFVTAGIWIALQMWDHYTFNADVEFLRTRAYPVLRDAALFFLDYMVAEPKHGWLVTGPSDSPENWYKTPSGGRAAESMGNTIDRVFVHALYTMCIAGIEDALHRRRSAPAPRKRPREAAAVSDWPSRPVAGVARRLRRRRAEPSPYLAAGLGLSRASDLSAHHAGSRACRGSPDPAPHGRAALGAERVGPRQPGRLLCAIFEGRRCAQVSGRPGCESRRCEICSPSPARASPAPIRTSLL